MPPAADVYIQATGTDPDVQALAAVEAAHRRLLDALAGPAGGAAEGADAAAVESAVELLHRLVAATDQTLYAAASGAAETRLLVRALRAASGAIGGYADALAAAEPAERAAAARTLAGLLTVHLGVEREVLLPALAALPGVDLPALAGDFGTVLDGGQLEEQAVIDVREIPHGRRHPRIFTRFARLAPGESFVLVNNHDPKPLRREFQAVHPDAFTWEYVESGPEQWQVRITRAGEDG